MYALKHARMGGNPEAIADVKNEVDVMKAVRGHPHVLTLRAVVMQGPPGGEVRVVVPSHLGRLGNGPAPVAPLLCSVSLWRQRHPCGCANRECLRK